MSLGGAGAGPAVGLPEVLSLAFSEGGRRLTNQKYSLSPILASFIILSLTQMTPPYTLLLGAMCCRWIGVFMRQHQRLQDVSSMQ